MNAYMMQCLHAPEKEAHMVQLYRDAERLAAIVAEYAGSGIERGDGIVMIVRHDHQHLFLRKIRERGAGIETAIASGRLVVLDAQETLRSICAEDGPAWSLANDRIGSIVHAMKRRHGSVRVYGEMVDLLWQQQDSEQAARLELIWNRLVHVFGFSLLCGYEIDDMDPASYAGPLRVICGGSSHLLDSPYGDDLDDAVDRALDHVLGRTIAGRIRSLAQQHAPRVKMNAGQATLFFLADHMPHATERVLGELRA